MIVVPSSLFLCSSYVIMSLFLKSQMLSGSPQNSIQFTAPSIPAKYQQSRLDSIIHYRKGGDSLFGRYRYFRLHPYSLDELGATETNLDRLFAYGGFPEPLLAQSDRELRR